MKSQEIKQLRTELVMTQAVFAEKVGTTVTTISRWESGISKPLPIFVRRMNQIKGECNGL